MTHFGRTKKQTDEIEVLVSVLNEVKNTLNDRIARYGENVDIPNVEFSKSSENLDSVSFSSSSTLIFREETMSGEGDKSFKPD